MTDEPNRAMEITEEVLQALSGDLSGSISTTKLGIAQPIIEAAMAERDAEIARLKQAIARQASAVRTLQHCETTEINTLRAKQTEAHRATVTLDSEREANAILTDELAEQADRIRQLEEALADLEPFLDAIICFASSQGEYEPNRIAAKARALRTKGQADDR